MAWLFETMPTRFDELWSAPADAGAANSYASYVAGDCDWKDSLVERPADV